MTNNETVRLLADLDRRRAALKDAGDTQKLSSLELEVLMTVAFLWVTIELFSKDSQEYRNAVDRITKNDAFSGIKEPMSQLAADAYAMLGGDRLSEFVLIGNDDDADDDDTGEDDYAEENDDDEYEADEDGGISNMN